MKRALTIAGFFILTPPAAVGGGLALAPLQALAAIIGGRWERTLRLRAAPPALWAVFAFVVWACVTAAWSPSGYEQALKTAAGVALGCLFVASASAPVIGAAGLAGCVVLIALSIIEALFAMPLNRLAQPEAVDWVLARNPGKGVSILLCVLWPSVAFALAQQRRALAALITVAAGALSMQFGAAANHVVFLAALIAFALAFITPKWTLRGGGALMAVLTLAAPALVPANAARFTEALPFSWAERLHIWAYAADRIAEKPWFGWGFDASRAFTAQVRFRDALRDAIPLHPHNAPLQIWLETGFIGAALVAAALLLGAWRLSRIADKRSAAAIAGAAAAYFTAANLSFGAWQEWWVATGFAAAALIAALPRQNVSSQAQ